MTFASVAKRAEKLIADNSPAILTAVGVTGVVATAYLTGRATFKAAQLIALRQNLHDLDEKSHEFTPKENLELVWKCYIPPAIAVTATIAAIIAANQIGTRRTAAVVAAFSVTEKAFAEYRDKVVEKVGEKKAETIRTELAQERVEKNPIDQNKIIVTGNGNVLCYEEWTGRPFYSDMETLRKAQNDINERVLKDNYASLSDFYDLIGLERTSQSSEIGWRSDGRKLDLVFDSILTADGRPCMSVGYSAEPIRDYYKSH